MAWAYDGASKWMDAPGYPSANDLTAGKLSTLSPSSRFPKTSIFWGVMLRRFAIRPSIIICPEKGKE